MKRSTTLLRATAGAALAISALTCGPQALAAPVPAATKPADPIIVRIGSTGAKVRDVQRIIHTTVDGRYGRGTAAAVVKWQRAHHLPATGVVDLRTWNAMHPRPTKPKPKAPTIADCSGFLVARSHVVEANHWAQLTGTITNETGFTVDFGGLPGVQTADGPSWDHIELNADLANPPAQYASDIGATIPPHGHVTYRSIRVHTVDLQHRWSDSDNGWVPIAQFIDANVVDFCHQRDVPPVHLVD